MSSSSSSSSSKPDGPGSTFDLHEALTKLEPDVISATTRDEAISRSRAGSAKKKFSLAMLPRFSRSPSPGPGGSGRRRRKPGQAARAQPQPQSADGGGDRRADGSAAAGRCESAGPTQLASNKESKEKPAVTKQEQQEQQPQEPKEYRVVKEFKANEDTELSLEVGDLIELLEKPATDQEFWWYGISRTWGPNNGMKGFFPKECVVLETFQETDVAAPVAVAPLISI
ncbi:hypothetical protein BDR26DRAFT_983518 [Obelidium mucronatum]|nr:hypothetical protein BDR26DRAFT_983518 [Obelidium mucronatum]